MWSRPIKWSPIHDCSDRGWNQRTIIVEYTLQHSLGRNDELAAQHLEAHDAVAAMVVDVVPSRKLPRPVTLAEIKADPAFKTFPLVRISRLSVMPVTDAEWKRIETLAGKT